jgi:hypothetical protein
MDEIVGTLRLGWNALLFKEEAYEEMRTSTNPVTKGLILIVVIGLLIAVLNLIGTGLELASMPNLGEIKDKIYFYLQQMPWFEQAAGQGPEFKAQFDQWYNLGWDIFPRLFGAPDLAGAVAGILFTPLGLIIRWLFYGLLAYLFARWLGGTGEFSETLGVLALSVAPQVINVLGLLPYVQVGSLVSVWGVLVAYMGLKTAHRLSWGRAVWATLLPFVLVWAVLFLMACFSTAVLGAVTGGQR